MPPSSKKLASTLTAAASTPSTAANASRAAASSAVRGATTAAASDASARDGAGSRRRSILPLLVRGHASTPTTTDGSMYAGSADRAPPSDGTRSNGRASANGDPPSSTGAPSPSTVTALAGLTYATSAGSAAPPSARSSTTASSTRGCARSACSTSPSSSRWPRSFTCESMRPPNSSSPSAYQRTRSPVRYATPRRPDDSAAGHGWATKRSAVSSGRRR